MADEPLAAGPGRDVLAMRTEFSRTRVLANGNYETTVSSIPLHFRAVTGDWRRIDNELVPSASGALVNEANSVAVEIPELADGEVRFAAGGRAVSFSLVAAGDAAVEADGAVAEFEDAVGAVDVSYEVVGKALKESLTLPAASAPSVYRFDVKSDGLSPRVTASGAVMFEDASGHRQLGFAAPWMRDAAGVVSRAARYEIEDGGERSRIALRLDRGWLDAPERSYPVIVDPTVYRGTEHLCEIRSGSNSNTTLCDGALTDLWIGRDANGIVHRGLFQLGDLAEAVPDYVQVIDSWFAVYLDSQTPVEPSEIDLHHLTRGFTPGATWNRSDGRALWSRPGGDFNPQREARRSTDDSASDGWIGFDMTELAEQIVSDKEASQNLLLKAADESRPHIDVFDWAEVRVQWRDWTGAAPRFKFQEFPLSDGSTLKFNVGNWNTVLESNDIDLESDDGRFTVGRFYNSYNSHESDGTFGRGSRGDFGSISLERNWQDGSYLFEGPGGDDGVFHKRNDGTFTPPRGYDATLVENVDDTITITFNDSTETWTFDADGRLVQTRQDYGYTIDGTYGPDGLATLRDSLGNSATFAYDGNGDMRTITDDQSAVHRYDYDGLHRLVTYTSPNGAQTRYAYDLQGRLASVDLPDRTAVRIAYAGNSWSPERVTPVDAAGVDQPATEFDGDYDYSTVWPPGGPTMTYFHDPQDIVVDLVQTDSAAAIAATGAIPDLHGRYTRADAPLTVDVSAAQAPDGIQLTELEVDGVEVDSVGDAPCDETTCPTRARTTLLYDSSFDADGTYDYRVNTVDGDGERSYSPTWTIAIDRTPPTPASNLAFVGIDDGEAEIIWQLGEDPAAADSTPGSGVAASEVRYRIAPAGAWSAWADAAEEELRVANASVGQQITVEVRSRDQVGNVAPVVAATVTIEDPISGDNQPILLELDENGEPIWPEPEASARASITDCRFGTTTYRPGFVAVSDDHPDNPRDVNDVMLEAHAWYRCFNPDGEARITSMKLIACIKMYLKDGKPYRQVCVEERDRTSIGPSSRFHTMDVEMNMLCRPGVRTYHLRVWGIPGQATGGAPLTHLLPNGDTYPNYRIACNNAGAWNYQATHSPAANRFTAPDGWKRLSEIRLIRRPSAVLGSALGDPPTPSGWEAHHIVAVRGWADRNSAPSQAAAYRCGIEPNGATNGAWLRGPSLASDTQAWRDLRPTSLRRRMYHTSIHTTRYFNALADRLEPLVTTWPEDCRNTMRSKLGNIRKNLYISNFPR